MNRRFDILESTDQFGNSIKAIVDADWLCELCKDWFWEDGDKDDACAMAAYENLSEESAWDAICEAVKNPVESKIIFTESHRFMNSSVDATRKAIEKIKNAETETGRKIGIKVTFDFDACENEYLTVSILGDIYSNCLGPDEAVSTVTTLLRGFQLALDTPAMNA